MMAGWLARLKSEKPPATYATKTTKTPPSDENGVFVGFVASPPSCFQKIEGREQPAEALAANDAPAPAPAPADDTGAPALMDWRQADADYLRHHWQCPSCCAAGHGRGQRCATGADLWATYEAACDAAQPSKTQGGNAR